MNFIDYMTSVCILGALFGIFFLIMEGVIKLIDNLSKGKFINWVIDFLQK